MLHEFVVDSLILVLTNGASFSFLMVDCNHNARNERNFYNFHLSLHRI